MSDEVNDKEDILKDPFELMANQTNIVAMGSVIYYYQQELNRLMIYTRRLEKEYTKMNEDRNVNRRLATDYKTEIERMSEELRDRDNKIFMLKGDLEEERQKRVDDEMARSMIKRNNKSSQTK